MISLIIPFMNSNPARLASFYFLLAWARLMYKNIGEIIVVEQNGETKMPDFVRRIAVTDACPLMLKAKCVNAGAKAAKYDLLLINDSDTLLKPENIPESLDEKTMVIPLIAQRALTKDETLAVLAMNPKEVDFAALALQGKRRFGGSPGGAQLISKALFKKSGGLDEGYVGHNGQDYDFEASVKAAGGAVRYPKDHFAVGIHLWHPIDQRGTYVEKNKQQAAARIANALKLKVKSAPDLEGFEAAVKTLAKGN